MGGAVFGSDQPLAASERVSLASADSVQLVQLTVPVSGTATGNAAIRIRFSGIAAERATSASATNIFILPAEPEATASQRSVGTAPSTASAQSSIAIPTAFGLSQNYPNPFNPATTIRYALPEAAKVSVRIYDMLGRVVSELVNETKAAGYYEARFDASRLSSGTYFYRLQAGSFVETKKMVLVK